MFQKGRKAKRSKKKKILSLIIVVAVTGTSGAVVCRKVRRPMAAATETDLSLIHILREQTEQKMTSFI